MKNKLLVSVFAVAIAALAFTSCEPKSDVTAATTDLLKQTLHGVAEGKSAARGFAQMDGQTLTLAEYEFPSKDVNNNILLYRTMTFGDGVFSPKSVDTLTYEYGEWQDHGTVFTLLITPQTDAAPYILKYRGDAFIEPDGRVFGGATTANVARVEKLEKVISTFPNTDWEGTFRGEFVLDSIFRDSIRTTFIPPMTFKKDTIKIFDHMDTISADTTCLFKLDFVRDLTTFDNTGHYYRKEVRSTYDKQTKETTIMSTNIVEYDFRWALSEISTDKKFTVQLLNTTTPSAEEEQLSISKFELDSVGVAKSFLLGGVNYARPVLP